MTDKKECKCRLHELIGVAYMKDPKKTVNTLEMYKANLIFNKDLVFAL